VGTPQNDVRVLTEEFVDSRARPLWRARAVAMASSMPVSKFMRWGDGTRACCSVQAGVIRNETGVHTTNTFTGSQHTVLVHRTTP